MNKKLKVRFCVNTAVAKKFKCERKWHFWEPRAVRLQGLMLTWGGPGDVLEVGQAVVPVLEAALETLLLLHHHYPGLHRVRRVQAGAATQTKKLLEKRHLVLLVFLSRFFSGWSWYRITSDKTFSLSSHTPRHHFIFMSTNVWSSNFSPQKLKMHFNFCRSHLIESFMSEESIK